MLNLEPLDERRQKIATSFAKKILKHPEHRKLFQFTSDRTRSGKKVILPNTKTVRYEKSPVPSLAKIINEKLSHKI